MSTTAGPADRRSVAFPAGAALLGDDGFWVLATGVGRALAMARQAGAGGPVHVVVEDADAPVVARQASQFAEPPVVWRIDGTGLQRVEPAPPPEQPAVDPRVRPFADVLMAAGADPVVEHGRLIGEVLGLEVARVVVGDDGPRLEVGVGRFDREAHAALGSDAQHLAGIVELVRQHRRVGGESHPLQLLATGRWLRSLVVRDPSLVGADHLAPMPATVEAPDLRTAWPAPASGVDTAGEPLVVVASVGVDLELVPAAADARLADGRDARLVLAVPTRDAHPVTRALAAALRRPAEVVTVDLA